MTHINNSMFKNKKGQAIIEYSVFFVVMVVTFVLLQGWLQRAVQGKARSSTDSIGDQFSEECTNLSRVSIVEANTTEQFDGDVVTRNTNQTYLSTETHRIDRFAAEYQG